MVLRGSAVITRDRLVQSLPGNRFLVMCCGLRRMVMPGDVVLCIRCDREGAKTIIPNFPQAQPIPRDMRTWEVPRA